MSFTIFLAFTAFSLALGDQSPVQVANKDFLDKQKSVYELLWHVDDANTVNSKIISDGKEFDIRKNVKLFDNETVVNNFLNQYESGMLPRGEIFSIFYSDLLEEALALIRLFKSAIKFDTFYKTAAWARLHVNEGLFIYAFSIAVVRRPDTKFMRLPNSYEMKPHEFFNTEILRQAHSIKMRHPSGAPQDISYTIMANESLNWYPRPQGDPEHKLNYLLEDVGWNGYYNTLSLEFPSWMSSDEFGLPKEYRGEQYFLTLKLIMVRYNLERISNGLNEIEDIDWNKPITMGYHPSMTYKNGIHFPQRDHDSMVPKNKLKMIQDIQNYEARINEMIDSGFVVDKEGKLQNIYSTEGFNILGNIIEGNADSINKQFYGSIDSLGRNILGFNPDSLSKYKNLPSALQHFTTSLRDPAYYRFCKRIVGFFERYKKNLDPYTPEELGASSGLKIESVTVDRLETHFDIFDSIIDDAVPVRDLNDAKSFNIKVRQYRLNHKPHIYSIIINATEETDAVIRMFIAPKFNYQNEEIDLSENYANFYEFDGFKVELKAGRNEIKRSSHETQYVARDQDSNVDFYRKLKKSLDENEPLTYSDTVYGYPDRLILPKGREEGLPLKIFVHVAPAEVKESKVAPITKGSITVTHSPIWGDAVSDGHAFGFPLDRPIKSNILKTVRTMFMGDVLVYHKKDANEINATT